MVTKMIGVNKEIDNLGRLVIPKEMRNVYRMEKEVELVLTKDGILIRNPEYKLVKKSKEIQDGE